MPRLPLHLASGTGCNTPFHKTIRLVRYGCANRPFFHIVIMDTQKEQRRPPIEQLGTYDPLPNQYNEKLVALNFERIQYWLGQTRIDISKPVAELLGLSGFLPVHPRTHMIAWRKRRDAAAAASGEDAKAESTG